MKVLRVILGVLAIFAFLYYQYEYVRTGNKPNEIFFIASCISISGYSLFSLRQYDSVFVSSITILCSSFFGAVIGIYMWRWVLLGDGSTNYYTAICISAVFTLIYSILYAILRHK